MSIIGTLFSCSFKTFICCKTDNVVEDDYKNIYSSAKQNNVIILPVRTGMVLKSLFPPKNEGASAWSYFVVGADKTYVIAHMTDMNFVGSEHLVNQKDVDSMPVSLRSLLSPIWQKTLTGKQLQFYCVYRGKAFLVNSWPFFNTLGEVIGAICFIRNFEEMPGGNDASRLSFENDDNMEGVDSHPSRQSYEKLEKEISRSLEGCPQTPVPPKHLASILENKQLKKHR